MPSSSLKRRFGNAHVMGLDLLEKMSALRQAGFRFCSVTNLLVSRLSSKTFSHLPSNVGAPKLRGSPLNGYCSSHERFINPKISFICSISFLETRLRKAASIVSVGCSWRYSSIAFEGIPITKMPTISDRIPLVRVKWHSRYTRAHSFYKVSAFVFEQQGDRNTQS